MALAVLRSTISYGERMLLDRTLAHALVTIKRSCKGLAGKVSGENVSSSLCQYRGHTVSKIV